MNEDNYNDQNQEEIFSKRIRAGKRTYFFDVKATRNNDYYITLTESKRSRFEDGSFVKTKIHLYKEDFSAFSEILEEMTSFILNNKGEEVISERHQRDFKKDFLTEKPSFEEVLPKTSTFTDIDFDDI